jgi:hypothetical protein
MKKAIGLVALLALWAGAGLGQNPIRFRSTETVGLSSGSAGNCLQVQTVNGVSKGPWFVGLGAGLDYYRFRSVPLFLSVTRDLAVGKRDWLFLYVDGGTNLPWYKRPAGSLISPGGGEASSTFHSGEYWSGGLGYLWKLGDHTSKAMLFSAGYTVKKLTETQTMSSNCCCGIPCPMVTPDPILYEYLCRAYQLMIGFRF